MASEVVGKKMSDFDNYSGSLATAKVPVIIAGENYKVDATAFAIGQNPDEIMYSANKTAELTDKDFLVMLNGAITSVEYTIDPVLFAKQTLRVRCKDDTNTVKVSVSSGVIENLNGLDETSVQMLKRQVLNLYSNGTNIIIL